MKKKKQPSRKRSIVLLSILCVLIVAFGVLAFVPFSYDEDGYRSYTSFAGAIELGIDLEGGTYAVLTPVYDEDNEDQTVEEQEQAFLDSLDASDGVLSVLRYRLTQLGYPEATVARQTDSYGEPSIRVEIPRVDSPADLFSVVGQQGMLEFTADESVTGVTNPIVTQDDIIAAIATYDSSSSSYAVAVQMTDEAADDFAKATQELSEAEDKTLTITMDGETVTTATVSSAITNGQGMITGLSTASEAQTLAVLIMSGSLPVSFDQTEPADLAPVLGENTARLVLIAGGACMLLVMILLIILYRGLGLAADLSLLILVIAATFIMAEIPGLQLTLPGVIALLFSFVLAADANVIIFRRIREEFAAGRTIVAAAQAGQHRGIAPIVDTHVAIALLAVGLWIFGGTVVQSFGILLFLGAALSLFGALAVTRLMIRLFLPINSTSEKFYNVKREEESAQ